jgi:hypothetical protein
MGLLNLREARSSLLAKTGDIYLSELRIEKLRLEAKENREQLNSVVGRLILFSHLEKIDPSQVDPQTLRRLYWQCVNLYAGKLETFKCLLSAPTGVSNFVSQPATEQDNIKARRLAHENN